MSDIELVIKIPEELYKTYKGRPPMLGDAGMDMIAQSISNSIPLQEHGDLIDKGKFKRWIETQDGDKLMTEYYLDALDMQETVVGGSYDDDID